VTPHVNGQNWQYSICGHIFEGIAATDVIASAADHGFDCVELLGEPEHHDGQTIRSALHACGITVNALTAAGRLSTGRDLSHPDPEVRAASLDHVRRCIYLAVEVECPVVAILLSPIGRQLPPDSSNAERSRALGALNDCLECARREQVRLAVEVVNRYVTSFPTTASEILNLLGPLATEVGLALDLFHMNIEEVNLGDVLRQVATALANLHVCDSNRLAPGLGGLDFRSIARGLVQGNYRGPLTLEFWPSRRTELPLSGEGEMWQLAVRAKDYLATHMSAAAAEQAITSRR
jgi:D-psicose/D-tagatose/L-ribulose 3-epimerase